MGSLHSRLALGLSRPECPEEIEDGGTNAGMRRAIEASARSSQLISECLRETEACHLGREEICVLLAYWALVELKENHGLLERLKTRLVDHAISNDRDGHL